MLPFAVKLLIVAASAVSAMMFGAGQALVPAADLATARRRVYHVLNKGRFGASADALAVLLDLPWRVDPEAYAVLALGSFLWGRWRTGTSPCRSSGRCSPGPVWAARQLRRWPGSGVRVSMLGARIGRGIMVAIWRMRFRSLVQLLSLFW